MNPGEFLGAQKRVRKVSHPWNTRTEGRGCVLMHLKSIYSAGPASSDQSAGGAPVPRACCVWVERGPHGVAFYASNAGHAIVERNHDGKGEDRSLEDPPAVPSRHFSPGLNDKVATFRGWWATMRGPGKDKDRGEKSGKDVCENDVGEIRQATLARKTSRLPQTNRW